MKVLSGKLPVAFENEPDYERQFTPEALRVINTLARHLAKQFRGKVDEEDTSMGILEVQDTEGTVDILLRSPFIHQTEVILDK